MPEEGNAWTIAVAPNRIQRLLALLARGTAEELIGRQAIEEPLWLSSSKSRSTS
jgi:hypothetical protein